MVATTNCYVSAEFKTVDTKTLFDHEKYQECNNDIMSAGGIASVVVSGRADGGSYAQVKVSLETAAERIKATQKKVAGVINRIMHKLNDMPGSCIPHATSSRVPLFEFEQIDLVNDGKFQQTCFSLWQQGVVSTETLLQASGFDMTQEVERRKTEAETVDAIFSPGRRHIRFLATMEQDGLYWMRLKGPPISPMRTRALNLSRPTQEEVA